jgi:hypothetical protein
MIVVIKVTICLFLLAWIALGVFLLWRYNAIFGPHPDDPSETPGARSLGLANVGSIWVGTLALGVYFLVIL